MGVFINLAIATSVTREEWAGAYQEALHLAESFRLAEFRRIPVRGIPTACLVPTEEHDYTFGHQEEVSRGWSADGDYESLRTAETFFLFSDLVTDDRYQADAPDAMFSETRTYHHPSGCDQRNRRRRDLYGLWDSKTQGQPYHMYLLSIACLIVSRLGSKAHAWGDITKGQCERAVRMANEHLDHEIHTPDQCDLTRLLARVDRFPLSEAEKIKYLLDLYIGRRDADFGAHVRGHFSEQAWDEYWMERFPHHRIPTVDLEMAIGDCLSWGFDLEKLCSYAYGTDVESTDWYEELVEEIMDTKLYLPEKDCTDVLATDPDQETPYGVGTLFAQFAFAGARNKKVDRHIPLDEIRAALTRAIGDRCPVNEIIDEYLRKEAAQAQAQAIQGRADQASGEEEQALAEQDPSSALSTAMEKRRAKIREMYDTYDICWPEDLPYYEAGDAVRPSLMDQVKGYFAFYHSTLSEKRYSELMTKGPVERCRWLAEQNRNWSLRDTDWEKIYDDIMENPESFERYYPMVRVVANSDDLRSTLRAFTINDALYSYLVSISQPSE